MEVETKNKYIFVGLGNPGAKYEDNRHNVGRHILELIAERNGFLEWDLEKDLNALVSEGALKETATVFLLPETFMNKSGNSVKKCVRSKKAIEKLVVVHDEIDLPLGNIKISIGKGNGGHNGVDSIIKGVGTKDFIRIRIGISPRKPDSEKEALKPIGEKEVLDFVLGDFSSKEMVEVVSLSKKVEEAMATLVTEGVSVAMNQHN